MPACGVAVSTDRWGPASLEHGTDDEPAQGSDQGDGEDVMVALRKVWAVMGAPAGKGDGAVPAGDRGPAAGLSRAGRPGRDRREVVHDVGGHDRPPAGRGTPALAAQGPLGHQTWFVAEVSDPDPDLGAVEREGARGSWRSTWSATRAATRVGSSPKPSLPQTFSPAGLRLERCGTRPRSGCSRPWSTSAARSRSRCWASTRIMPTSRLCRPFSVVPGQVLSLIHI